MHTTTTIPATEAFMIAGYLAVLLILFGTLAYLRIRGQRLQHEERELVAMLTDEQRDQLNSSE